MSKPNNVFISWSGGQSRHIAEALRNWLPMVIQSVRPFMSEMDIDKGSRGLDEITKALNGITVGISCLTGKNQDAPWILWEAGALAKTVDDRTRLCTYLLGGLRPQDVKPPLSMFQHTIASKEDTLKLLLSINKAVCEEQIVESDLQELFEAMWPKLEGALNSMPVANETSGVRRSMDEMVAEILDLSRAAASSRKKAEVLDEFIAVFEEALPLVPQVREGVRTLIRQQFGSVGEILGGQNKQQTRELREPQPPPWNPDTTSHQ